MREFVKGPCCIAQIFSGNGSENQYCGAGAPQVVHTASLFEPETQHQDDAAFATPRTDI
jgi:hypothetical protein